MHEQSHSFGYWLRRRRKALDLTQEALAELVFCSGFSIRKIEADERRPSRRLAERLAISLAIPAEELHNFLESARALRTAGRLRLDAVPLSTEGHAELTNSLPSGPHPQERTPASDCSSFFGRSDEFGVLVSLVARVKDGVGHTALIEGEPGIGKSRLMREIARYAQAHDVVAIGTNCYEIERGMPYQPVIDLVSRALDLVSDNALRNLPPVLLAELAALAPDISERFPELPRLSNDFPEARQARLPRAVAQLLDVLRNAHPLILLVDDIQWADDASAQVFHYLARHASQRQMLVVCAYRDEELDSDERLARLVESLRRDSAAQRISLARLSAADTGLMVSALVNPSLGATELAERLHRETEGNPFFLISILQSLNEGEIQLQPRLNVETGLLPDALRAAVRVRLAHVPKELRPVLETAAVLGRRFDFETLLEVTAEPEEQLLNVLEALVRRRLLREEAEGGIYDFSHDKVREVVYRDIGGIRRRLLHQAVAEALELQNECQMAERDARLAEHYERAHVWPKALRYLVLAGERSQKLFAMRDALTWFDRAVALCEAHPEALDDYQRFKIYGLRGAARAQAGQTQGAVADIRRVVDAARQSGNPTATRDALVQLGMAYRRADAYDQATECLTEALAESHAINDDHHAADILYHLGTVAWSTGLNNKATESHQTAVDICERSKFTDLVAVQAYHGRGEAHFANAEPIAAVRCYERSLVLARSMGEKSYESENLMMIGHACIGTKGIGDYVRAIESFKAALEIAHAADLQWHLGPTLLGLAHAQACTGLYGQAWSSMQKTLCWLESLNQVRYQLIAHDFMGYLLLDLGLNEMAFEQLKRALALGDKTGIMFWRAEIETQTCIARSRLGEKNLAPILHEALAQTQQNSERYLMVRCIDGLAEIALESGDSLRCRAYGDDLLAIALPNGLRELEAIARRWRGEALILERAYSQALVELSGAAILASQIGRVRLQLDLEDALHRLHVAQGNPNAALIHRSRSETLITQIEQSVQLSGIDVRLRAMSRSDSLVSMG